MRLDPRQWGKDSYHLCISCPTCSGLPTPVGFSRTPFVKAVALLSYFCFVPCSFVRRWHQDYSFFLRAWILQRAMRLTVALLIIFLSRCMFPWHRSTRRGPCCKEEKETFLVWVFRCITKKRIQSPMRMKTYTTLPLLFFFFYIFFFYLFLCLWVLCLHVQLYARRRHQIPL